MQTLTPSHKALRAQQPPAACQLPADAALTSGSRARRARRPPRRPRTCAWCPHAPLVRVRRRRGLLRRPRAAVCAGSRLPLRRARRGHRLGGRGGTARIGEPSGRSRCSPLPERQPARLGAAGRWPGRFGAAAGRRCRLARMDRVVLESRQGHRPPRCPERVRTLRRLVRGDRAGQVAAGPPTRRIRRR